MNKILVFVGLLVGMSNVSGMDIKPEFECNNEEWSVTCRNMSPENLKEHFDEIDCAIYVTFENCDLSCGVDCTNASSLTFKGCDCIESYEDVLKYVGLYYHWRDAKIIIDGNEIKH